MNSGVNDGPKLVVALDFDNAASCMQLVNQLSPEFCRVKIGKELFTACGPKVVENIQSKGFDVFLDLKFHDIPNTVAKACKAAAEMGVWMVNVHASGGKEMMMAAKKAIAESSHPQTKLLAVTVLTSMDQTQLNDVVPEVTPAEQVKKLAQLTADSGLDGVVCSAKEAVMLRETHNDKFLLVTPGIRPAGADMGDQKRVMTPVDAIDAGVSYLVMGRPITQASEPLAALNAVNDSLA